MKLYEVAQQQKIENVLKKIVHGKYKINSDQTVDVEGDVSITNRYTKIPVQFGYVSGSFSCSSTKITSLKGAPREVGGNFLCYGTKITSLEGGPREVDGNYVCSDTNITSLKGAPQEVNGNFDCSYTKITSLKRAPREVGGDFWCINIFKTEPDHSFINIGGGLYWD